MRGLIEDRLMGSIRYDAVNGSSFERGVVKAQMKEAANELRAMRFELTQLRTERDWLRVALETIAGDRPCVDNLMSDKDIARAALQQQEGVENE